MENNDTNTTNSSSLDFKFTSTVNIGLLIASGAFVFICLWIITLNGLLILCFWINRRKNWYSQSKNILSIIIIDLLVGSTTLMAFIASMKININLYECLVEFGLCLASQTATSLNVLRFCLIRFYSIRKTSVVREPTARMVVLQTLMIWILSSIIVLVPLVLWAEKQSVLRFCSWTYMFKTHESEVDIYMFNVLTLPTVTTTVLYGVLTIKLRKVKNCVNPSSTVSSVSPKQSRNSWSDTKTTFLGNKSVNSDASPGSVKVSEEIVHQISVLPSSIGSQETDTESFRINRKTATGNSTQLMDGKTTATNNLKQLVEDHNLAMDKVSKTEDVQNTAMNTVNQTMVAEGVSVSDVQETSLQADKVPIHTVANHLAVPNNTISKPAAMENRRTRMNKVIATTGVLLVLINISNLPYIIILAMNAVKPETKVSGLSSLLALLCLMLNSACNPIIYAVRLKPLRVAFFKMFRGCCECIYNITCCEHNS